jgi:hypothetical protein
MPFQLSPGVNVSEIDLTTVIPAVATTDGAIAGVFRWGPCETPILVTDEDELAARYGKPTNLNGETWFTAASFLAYGNSLYVSRAHQDTDGTDYAKFAGVLETGNTTVVVSGNTATGISTGDVVYGEGIPDGALVSSLTVVGSNTNIVISSESGATTTDTSDLQFFNPELQFNAIANSGYANLTNHVVKNEEDYESAESSFESDVQFIARYPGAIGNSLKVSVCGTANAYEQVISLPALENTATYANGDLIASTEKLQIDNPTFAFTIGSNTATFAVTVTSNTTIDDAEETVAVVDEFISTLAVGDLVEVGNSSIGRISLEISEIGTPVSTGNNTEVTISFTERYTLGTPFTATSSVTRKWQYYDLVESAPGQSNYQAAKGTNVNDELHVVVIDEDGVVSGTPGTVLEVWQNLSRATDSKGEDGSASYVKTVINQSSNFLWYGGGNVPGLTEAPSDSLVAATGDAAVPYSVSMTGGRDLSGESTTPFGNLVRAYEVFQDAEEIDISLVLNGKSRDGSNGTQLSQYLIDNIVERRKDCVVFISPEKNDVVNNAGGDEELAVVDFRNSLSSTSYAVIDSGYKYAYDKYNDIYRWVPLNGDIAGLCVRTDNDRDPWFSPAGFNRGQIKNVVKLAWNPKKAERDLLYKNGINPVVRFKGEGVILFGDKTALKKPSAFDRINVRRLFIVLEKAIATSARFSLFEFNDEFTRAQFVNTVEPFLRGVKAGRGIFDYVVICDETNNTGEVIDRNEFVGDIYIKPARSINFIQLNFIAVRTGVEFSEVIGNF